jgi:hypothetical protein
MPVDEAAPTAEAIARAAGAAARRGPAPVHLWDPPYCGDIDMRIAADGAWFYMGTPIGRPAMVRLFASVLRREGDRFFLVTPVEKVGITVEDAPFVATDFRAEDDRLVFTTNIGDETAAGPDNPLRFALTDGEPRPYVHVRRGLEALIDRKTFYRLIDLGEIAQVDGTAWFGVRSDGAFFPIQPAAELDA